jgi:hypothetical protein
MLDKVGTARGAAWPAIQQATKAESRKEGT